MTLSIPFIETELFPEESLFPECQPRLDLVVVEPGTVVSGTFELAEVYTVDLDTLPLEVHEYHSRGKEIYWAQMVEPAWPSPFRLEVDKAGGVVRLVPEA